MRYYLILVPKSYCRGLSWCIELFA